MTIDPLVVTLISKAIDLLFNEVKAIVVERRTRRATPKASDSTEIDIPHPTRSEDDGGSTSREDILEWDLQEVTFRQREREIRALVNQLSTHKDNLNRAQEQAAKWGDALVPAIIANTIEDEERNIIEKGIRLEKCLEAVYGRSINLGIEPPNSPHA